MEIEKMNNGYFGLSGMHDPFLLHGMNDAISRISKAVNEREKIIIYGSQDLDGVTAVSLLILVLKYLNADLEYFIPDKMEKSNEISSDIIKNHIKFLGAKLIITVGCGINSNAEVELCRKLGIDIIITDYHICEEQLPNTTVLSPNKLGCKYPFKDLASVGIAYKLVQAIAMYYQMKSISKYLDLVMMGTVSARMPLVGENKIIVDAGLYQLSYTNNYGIKALMKINRITNINIENVCDFTEIIIPESSSLKIANDSRIVVELFTTLNSDRAEQIAKYLKSQIKRSDYK